MNKTIKILPILQLNIHRKEQLDLECDPIVCVHIRTYVGTHRIMTLFNTVEIEALSHYSRSKRVFCIWKNGIEVDDYSLVW